MQATLAVAPACRPCTPPSAPGPPGRQPAHLVRSRHHHFARPQQQQVGVAGHALIHHFGGGPLPGARRKGQAQHPLVRRGQPRAGEHQPAQRGAELRPKGVELGCGAAGGCATQAHVGVARVPVEVQPGCGRCGRGGGPGWRFGSGDGLSLTSPCIQTQELCRGRHRQDSQEARRPGFAASFAASTNLSRRGCGAAALRHSPAAPPPQPWLAPTPAALPWQPPRRYSRMFEQRGRVPG